VPILPKMAYNSPMHPPRELIQKLIAAVTEASRNPAFIHHPWFVEYHLAIVARIADELVAHYPQANPELVTVMAWMHDYGKILDFDHQYEITLREGPKLLRDIGFATEFADMVIEYIAILDRKMELDLHEAPIEVQIVSSADGCSHMVGPFMALYWWENANRPFKSLMESNLKKADKDWNRKIILPEARQAFEARHQILLEQAGHFPDTFLS
jgi:HD domain